MTFVSTPRTAPSRTPPVSTVLVGGRRLAVAQALGLALFSLLLRLPLLPRWLEDHDSAHFALGLGAYDLSLQQPHFPGYPVFLALAWPGHALGLAEPAALALPAAVGGALAAAALAAVLVPWTGRRGAVLAALFYILLPGIWLADRTPLSDGLGLHLWTLALCAALAGERRPWLRTVAALGLGLLLGVRMSAWPLVAGLGLGLLFRTRDLRSRLAYLGWGAAGVLVWLAPLTLLAGGPAALVDLGSRFVQGHLYGWGNTAVGTGAGLRLDAWGWSLGTWGLGLAGLGTLGIWLAAGRDRLAPARPWWLLAVPALAYAGWLLLGQNPDKPRHVLPLLPVMGIAVALWAGRRTERAPWRLALPALLALLAWDAAARVAVQAGTPSTEVRAARWLARQSPEQAVWFGGSEVGVLRALAPGWRSHKVHSGTGVDEALAIWRARPHRVLVSSRVPALDGASGLRVPLATFAPRPGVDPQAENLVVYALVAAAPAPQDSP